MCGHCRDVTHLDVNVHVRQYPVSMSDSCGRKTSYVYHAMSRVPNQALGQLRNRDVPLLMFTHDVPLVGQSLDLEVGTPNQAMQQNRDNVLRY